MNFFLDQLTGNGLTRVIRRWQRYRIFNVTVPLPRRWAVDLVYSPCFDGRRPGPNRLVVSIAAWNRDHLNRVNRIHAVLFQRYQTGYELTRHTDLDGSNRVVWILLKRAGAGGDLFVEGPVRSWLWGRVKAFDGGRQEHGFSKITAGTRMSLILQLGTCQRC